MARHPEDRLSYVSEQLVETRNQWQKYLSPSSCVGAESFSGAIDRLIQDASRSIIKWMSTVNLWGQPSKPMSSEVEFGEERRSGCHGVSCRAVVVDQTRDDHLRAASTASYRRAGFEDSDLDTGSRQLGGRRESIGSASDHDRTSHPAQPVTAAVFSARHVVSSGIGPSGSHGWVFTAVRTFQVPRSMTPRDASIT